MWRRKGTGGLTLFTQASREVQRTVTEERRGSAGQRDGPTGSAVETEPLRANRWRLGGWDTPVRRGFHCDEPRRGVCGVCWWVRMPRRPTHSTTCDPMKRRGLNGEIHYHGVYLLISKSYNYFRAQKHVFNSLTTSNPVEPGKLFTITHLFTKLSDIWA